MQQNAVTNSDKYDVNGQPSLFVFATDTFYYASNNPNIGNKNSRYSQMKKLIAALVVGLFATGAFAQASAPAAAAAQGARNP